MTDPGSQANIHQKSGTLWSGPVLLCVILLIACGLRTYQISKASYWFDEGSSWKTIQYEWDEMLVPISRNVHPPLYYYSLKAWAICFGDGPVSLRLFSMTFGLLTIASAYLLVLEWSRDFGKSGRAECLQANFAAALIALSTLHVELGFNARMYTLATFLAVSCAYFLFRILRSGGSLLDWCTAIGCGIGLTLTHYFGLMTAAAFGAYFLAAYIWGWFDQGWSTRTKAWTLGMLATVIVAANVWGWWYPYFDFQRSQVTDSYWIRKVTLERVLQIFSGLLTGKESYGPGIDWGWGAVAVFVFPVLILMFQNRRGNGMVAFAIAVPFAVGITYSMQVRSIFIIRYFVFAQVFLLIGWAMIVGTIKWEWLKVCICGFSIIWMSYWTYKHCKHLARESEVSQIQEIGPTLDEWRTSGDAPAIVGTPVIHPLVMRYQSNTDNVYVVKRTYRFPHFQGDPLMRDREYYDLSRLDAESVDKVYTIDVYGLYGRGSDYTVSLSWKWELVRQKWFQEKHGHKCRIFLKEYRRIQSQ